MFLITITPATTAPTSSNAAMYREHPSGAGPALARPDRHAPCAAGPAGTALGARRASLAAARRAAAGSRGRPIAAGPCAA